MTSVKNREDQTELAEAGGGEEKDGGGPRSVEEAGDGSRCVEEVKGGPGPTEEAAEATEEAGGGSRSTEEEGGGEEEKTGDPLTCNQGQVETDTGVLSVSMLNGEVQEGEVPAPEDQPAPADEPAPEEVPAPENEEDEEGTGKQDDKDMSQECEKVEEEEMEVDEEEEGIENKNIKQSVDKDSEEQCKSSSSEKHTEQSEREGGSKDEANNNIDEKCGSDERETKSASEESRNKVTDKPYKCSKCKYSAKCVASVNIHQRRNHAGEWTTVISTLPGDKTDDGRRDNERQEGDGKPSSGDEDDREVRQALHSPVLGSDSDSDDDGEEGGAAEEREYRCSMCTFTAKDTDTVFDHQRTEHPGEWQLNDSDRTEEHKEEEEEEEERLYELPTELDQYSEMGRSIIAGIAGSTPSTGRPTPTTITIIPAPTPTTTTTTTPGQIKVPGNQLQYWQGYNRLTGRFHCPNCPAYFYEASQHTRHLKVCMKSPPGVAAGQYRCLLCKRIFPDMDALKPHMTSHQRYFRAFRCSCCGYNAKFEGTILAHIRQRHPTETGAMIERIAEQSDIDEIPNQWEKITTTGLEAEDVTDDPDLQRLFGGVAQCVAQCSTAFPPDVHDDDSSNSSSLADTDNQDELSPDNQNAMKPEELTPEMFQSLRVGNNYVCPECPVLFREPVKLMRHLDIHSGVKRHVCNICNKRFTRSEHLKRHRFVHATTKPYMCSICCYSTKRLDNLQKHQKVKHPGEQYTVIRVSKEMLEAEIAANSDSQAVTAVTNTDSHTMTANIYSAGKSTTSKNIKVVMPSSSTGAQPYILPTPTLSTPASSSTRPRRGRPRKISSPDEMFVFSRDPDLVGTNTTTTVSSVTGDVGLMMQPQIIPPQIIQPHLIQPQIIHTQPSIQHSLSQGGILSITGLASLNPSQPVTSTSLLSQGIDLSSIAAAAVAQATSTPITITPITDNSADVTQSDSNNVSLSDINDPDSPKAGSGLLNRGKYQCHVCDRPFSYLKPFKKHLLCHGTFMPYQCSVCGHQTKRRDMMQDHQRDKHAGVSCDIQVMEPTADMHDMMDTYIQQQPASPQSNTTPTSYNNTPTSYTPTPTTSYTPTPTSTSYDERKVDPQIDMQALGLNLQVKTEVLDEPLMTSTPDQKETSQGERSTSSPSVLSAAASKSPHMLRPQARRLIKFKVLSPHTRRPRPILPKPDQGEKVKEEEGDEGEGRPGKRPAGEDAGSAAPSKIVRLSSVDDDSDAGCYGDSEIGTAPRMSIMGLRPRQKLVTPKHYDIGFQLSKDLKPGEVVVDLKSNKGTPKAKQGENHRFSCNICDQRFAYEKPFKRHLLVHGGFEPYRCNLCGHQTTSRDSMKLHQIQSHANVRNAGITVLDPTPDMEQSLIKQGLLTPSQPLSDDEDSLTSKSIVEAARIEQHMMANAIKSLSNTVKGKNTEDGEEKSEAMPSFHSLLGLKPKTEGEEVEGGETGVGEEEEEVKEEYDEMCDMPVDEALFVTSSHPSTSTPSTSLLIDPHSARFECDFCGKTFHCNNKLQRHIATHTGTKAYECQICFKKLTRLEHLKRHLLTHGNLKPYKCSNCDFDAKRLDIVQLHQQTTHPGEPVGIEYLFTPSIMTPSRTHDEDDKSRPSDYACSMCGTRFREMSNLIQHQKLHVSGQKPYECYICHKTFTRPEHLKRHRLVHDDTKPYRCSECGFKTKRLDGMREHQRSRHPAAKPFIIDTILADSPNVKRKRGRPPKFDTNRLDGLQLINCDKCSLAFYDQGRYEQHKLSHIPSPAKCNTDLTCHLCGVRVSQAKHLRRHMLLHQDHYPYQCSHCFYTTKRTDHMKLHFRKSHPEETPQIIYVAKDHTASTTQPINLDDEEDVLKALYSSPGAESLIECHSDSTGHSYLTDHSDLLTEGSGGLDGSNNDGSNIDDLSNTGGSTYGDGSNVREEGDGEEGVAGEGATAF